MFTAHHFTLSVADLNATVTFYGVFGFRPQFAWEADDGSLRIVHLALDGFILELFGYATNAGRAPRHLDVGNDLPQLGVKHLALQVCDLQQAKEHLAAAGLDPGAPITHGRTGLDYFFVRDPEGLWMEIVEDHRPRVPEPDHIPGSQ
jgi:glyoxylase I family protein